MGVKQCIKCGEEKSLTEYYHQKDKPKSYCKVCAKQYSVKYFKTGKGKQIRDKWVKKKQGVYGIFDGETCLYVGESQQINHRFSEHRANIKRFQQNTHKLLYDNLKQHSNLEFRILEETPNHKEQEQVWIDYYSPLYNIYR